MKTKKIDNKSIKDESIADNKHNAFHISSSMFGIPVNRSYTNIQITEMSKNFWELYKKIKARLMKR